MHQDSKSPRFAFLPPSLDPNDYCARMTEVLGTLGAVLPVQRSTPSRVLAGLLWRTRLDLAFLSWYDNHLIDEAGEVSVARCCRVILRTLALRAQARKLVFVRHNHMPHGTRPEQRALARRLVDLYERLLFDGSITHSPSEARGTRMYCPHPLYRIEAGEPAMPATLPAEYFVVFGRIERYKQIDKLVRAFPPQLRLIVCGRCGDETYLSELARCAGENIQLLHRGVSDTEAQALIRRSSGVVISHASDDMVVSASFFYAMTLGKRVYAVATPFIQWASEALGHDTVVVASDLEDLCGAVTRGAVDQAQENAAAIQEHFGDGAVARHLAAVIEGVTGTGRLKRSLRAYLRGRTAGDARCAGASPLA